MAEFGRLEPVDLRTAWRHEALNFTPWLAENLDRLSQAVGIEMSLEDTEVQIDRFSADILARNAQDDSLVLIENQLEWSDHTHLGQILTYLAGLQAQSVIWVASATAANAHDVTQARNLLHGGETVVWGDAGYQGVHKRRENLGLEVEWRVAMRPGSRRTLEPGSEEALEEKAKASVRAKVEHPFLRLKRLFGYGKVRYRGLAKNMERLALLFGLGNLLTAEGQLAA